MKAAHTGKLQEAEYSKRKMNRESSPIETDDVVDFQVKGTSGSLNAKYITDFNNMIRGSVDRVDEL